MTLDDEPATDMIMADKDINDFAGKKVIEREVHTNNTDNTSEKTLSQDDTDNILYGIASRYYGISKLH